MEILFNSLYGSNADNITVTGFVISLVVSLLLGLLIAWAYTYKSEYSKSFAVTLAIIPPIVGLIILMVSGSLGVGIAVAGTFSLVRFRSLPGTAKEIGSIFLSMAIGLACGMGYVGIAIIFALVMCLVMFVYESTPIFGGRKDELQKTLHITVPEDLDYTGVFDDIFARYTDSAKLKNVKTTNLGSLNRLTYDITLKQDGTDKAMIDELRCRNGNLEISISMKETPQSVL